MPTSQRAAVITGIELSVYDDAKYRIVKRFGLYVWVCC